MIHNFTKCNAIFPGSLLAVVVAANAACHFRFCFACFWQFLFVRVADLQCFHAWHSKGVFLGGGGGGCFDGE